MPRKKTWDDWSRLRDLILDFQQSSVEFSWAGSQERHEAAERKVRYLEAKHKLYVHLTAMEMKAKGIKLLQKKDLTTP